MEITNIVWTDEFGGALRGEMDGKPVFIPAYQKPYFFKNQCVIIIFRLIDGWTFEGPLPEIEIEIEPGRMERTNRCARSSKLVKLCREMQTAMEEGRIELGRQVATSIQLET